MAATALRRSNSNLAEGKGFSKDLLFYLIASCMAIFTPRVAEKSDIRPKESNFRPAMIYFLVQSYPES